MNNWNCNNLKETETAPSPRRSARWNSCRPFHPASRCSDAPLQQCRTTSSPAGGAACHPPLPPPPRRESALTTADSTATKRSAASWFVAPRNSTARKSFVLAIPWYGGSMFVASVGSDLWCWVILVESVCSVLLVMFRRFWISSTLCWMLEEFTTQAEIDSITIRKVLRRFWDADLWLSLAAPALSIRCSI